MLNVTEQENCLLWRNRNHVTLAEVAKYIGCSQSLISKWERSRMNISEDKIALYRAFIREKNNDNIK